MNLVAGAKTPLPVLIIGAGVGGLTLAHSLAKHKIPYRLFERDSGPVTRAQGYRVSIDDAGASALKLAVTPEVFAKFEATCGEQHRPVGRVDARTGDLLQGGVLGLIGTGGTGMVWALLSRYARTCWGRLGQVEPTPLVPITVTKHYQIDRQMLRSILLESQAGKINYGRALSSYTVSADSVTAHFDDGTSARGSLLVGADGTRSRVAVQLTGDTNTTLDLGVRIIYGKTPLTPATNQALSPVLRHGVAFVRDDEQNITVVLEAMRFHHAEAPGDYIFWAVSTKADRLGMNDEDLLACQGPAAAKILTSLTAEWHPGVKVLFEQQAEEQTAVLRMTSSHPDKKVSWQTDPRVTVLGDAVHCMPPTGGQGANAALHDAAALGEILGRAGTEKRGTGWSRETIERYEVLMRWNVGDVVGLACIAASKMFGARLYD